MVKRSSEGVLQVFGQLGKSKNIWQHSDQDFAEAAELHKSDRCHVLLAIHRVHDPVHHLFLEVHTEWETWRHVILEQWLPWVVNQPFADLFALNLFTFDWNRLVMGNEASILRVTMELWKCQFGVAEPIHCIRALNEDFQHRGSINLHHYACQCAALAYVLLLVAFELPYCFLCQDVDWGSTRFEVLHSVVLNDDHYVLDHGHDSRDLLWFIEWNFGKRKVQAHVCSINICKVPWRFY